MKFLILLNKIILLCCVIALSCCNGVAKESISSSKTTRSWLIAKPAYNEKEAKKIIGFSKNVECVDFSKLKKGTGSCRPHCFTPTGNNHSLFYVAKIIRKKKYVFNYMIHYDDNLKEAVISFSGPDVSLNPTYISSIYSDGFVKEKRIEKTGIEKEFHVVYFEKLRNVFFEKIRKFLKSGRQNFRFVLNGHSIGGSIAILAAFDLIANRVIQPTKLVVYTYGALRIGDSGFEKAVNRKVSVLKVIKKSDHLVRAPACYFISVYGEWRCFPTILIQNFYAFVFYNKIVSYNLLLVRLKSFVTLYTKNQIQVETKVMKKYVDKRDKMIKNGFKQVKILTNSITSGKDVIVKQRRKKIIAKHKIISLKKQHVKRAKESRKSHIMGKKKVNEKRKIGLRPKVGGDKRKRTKKKKVRGMGNFGNRKTYTKHPFFHTTKKAIDIKKLLNLPAIDKRGRIKPKKYKSTLHSAKIKHPKSNKSRFNPLKRPSLHSYNKRIPANKGNSRKTLLISEINSLRAQISMLDRGRKTPSIVRRLNILRQKLAELLSKLSSFPPTFIEIGITNLKDRVTNEEAAKLEEQSGSNNQGQQIFLRYLPVFRNLLFYNEAILSVQPIGNVILYTDDFAEFIACTVICHKYELILPTQFTYVTQTSYFGEDFKCNP